MGYCYNLLVSLFILMWARGELVEFQPPKVVNVGSVFTFSSVIGRSAKVGIEAAFDDINGDPRILTGIKLNPIMKDSSCSVFMGSVEAFQVLGQEVVAIIGPLSSSIAHMISLIANGLQVPLVSFGVTDPTLSALQFPYFFRVALSDSYQMSAMADLIDYYEWHEVIVVYVDNDYGRNGISSLDDKLSEKMIRISYKVVLPDKVNPTVISDMLEKSKSIGPRVYVVHVNPDSGQEIFSVASRLQMMTQDYVWFATEWLAASLDSSLPMNLTTLRLLQGVIGLRQHVSDSNRKKAFVLKKKKTLREDSVSSGLNNYGLYAYDTVWTVARAIDALLKENGNISFSFDKRLHSMKPSAIQLGNLKTFDNGSLLLEKLKQTNFNGLTGQVQFDSFRGRVDGAYDVINIDQEGMKIIGYWSNNSGLSVMPPEILNRDPKKPSRVNPTLKQAMWPGEKRDKPRGWVAATNERPLIIGIPKRASFVDFVTEDVKSHEITGYCIDVFKASLKLVPYDVPHRFVAFGNGKTNPSYDELVRKIAADEYDAAVGDITIVTNRTKIADFTQPYAANGLVIVIPNKDNKSRAWVFLKPFTVEMWCVTAAFFVVIGVVVWILEHRINDDFRGPPKRQLITMFLFSFSTLFKTNQEDTISTLGRMVMMVWLFLVMVITSSYTASLTSILTIQQLSSPITGIDSLVASNLPIGFQVGSFAQSYLMENFNVPQSRLVSVENPADYARVLRLGPKNGGVGAIVDELPYVELFLSNEKGFGIVGEMITKNGWGFAFKRGSPLAIDMSTAILKLSERGELQRIHKQWFCKNGCESQKRHTSNSNQLHLNSFWGLYLLCGTVTLTAFVIFLLNTIRQFVRYKKKQRDLLSQSTSVAPSNTRCAQVIYNFFDFIDEKEEAIKKMFKSCDHVQPEATRCETEMLH